MVWWKLSEEQRGALTALLASTMDERIRRNARVILLSGQGRSKEWIAEHFECSLGTINNIRRRYRLRGLAGLKPAPRPGRRSRATPQYRAAMQRAVHTAPERLGYGFRAWSASRLAVHLERETGIPFSDDQVRRILQQEGLIDAGHPDRPRLRARVRPAAELVGAGRVGRGPRQEAARP